MQGFPIQLYHRSLECSNVVVASNVVGIVLTLNVVLTLQVVPTVVLTS